MTQIASSTNPFATATAFADIESPWAGGNLNPHRGCYVSKLQVSSVSKVYVDGVPVWVRMSEANASTDDRTVILHCYDIALPGGIRANLESAYALTVFRKICENYYAGAVRAEEQAEWMFKHAEVIQWECEWFVRVCCVEDLS